MSNKTLDIGVLEFKALSGDRTFSCYGNVKGNIDHAQDRVMEGAYRDSIAAHKAAGTMPKLFWMHDRWSPPVGIWTTMEEDKKGLYLEGKFSNTPRGDEIYQLYKDTALDSFSIGYSVQEERWNPGLECNDLLKISLKEISAVTFVLRALLESLPAGLSKRQIERITADYKPSSDEIDLEEVKGILEISSIFK
jgi:HK97 family phage prohead protease